MIIGENRALLKNDTIEKINMRFKLIKKVFPVGNHSPLLKDLDDNPVVQHALSIVAGEIYHKFGLLIAPISAMLTTLQHVVSLSLLG